MLRKEAGQALPMALILVFLGAAVVIPTLYFSTTNIKSTQVTDQKTLEAYAADAGIDDALWHLQSDEQLALLPPFSASDNLTYNFKTSYPGRDDVNNKDVTVTMERVWVLGGNPFASTYNVPVDWPEAKAKSANLQYAVMGAINTDFHNNYIVDMNTNETGTINLAHIGVWLPKGYSYAPGSVKINGVPIGGPGTNYTYVKEPTSQPSLRGGTALIWDYSGRTFPQLAAIAPLPSGGLQPAQKYPPSITLSFTYTNNPVVTPFKEAEGFFPWLRLTTPNKIAWDTENQFFYVVSTGTTTGTNSNTVVEAYVPTGVTRYVTSTGKDIAALGGDYITIGNSLMTECWYRHKVGKNYVIDVGPDPDGNCPYTNNPTTNCRGKQFTQSSATINLNAVPQDAQIATAYLYWTAWWKTNGADQQATLSVNDIPVAGGGTVAANTWYVAPAAASNTYQYACFANVTDQVKAITAPNYAVNGTKFTVGGVSAVPATAPDVSAENQCANAAWSMVIIYSSPSVNVHQIFLYDRLAYLFQGTGTFTITGFKAPATGIMDAKVGTFVAEGDPQRAPDYFEFKGQQFPSYVYLGDKNSTDPNYYQNIFNAYSSATGVPPTFTPSTLDGQPVGKIAGVDLESFTQDKDGNSLSNKVLPNDTSANIRVNSSNSQSNADGIMLVYMIFSVRSSVPAAGEGYTVGTMMYQFR
jgi:hypothetical protein